MRVAIDSGHGSETAGKRHPDGYREHYSNTYMAFYLDQILTANGIETFKSGWNDNNAKDDVDISLTNRQKNIKNAKCDISVSIHANAYGDGKTYNSANGVSTYYYNNSTKAKDSARLAKLVQNNLIKGTKQTNRGIKTAAFAMVNCVAMNVQAAVLVETAFMTNKVESDLLKSDAFAVECAKEIAQGIFEYFGIKGNVDKITLESAIGKVPSPEPSVKPTEPIQPTNPGKISAGDVFELNNTPIYTSSTASSSKAKKSGTYYAWNSEIVNGRIRLTNNKNYVNKTGKVSCWAKVSDLNKIGDADKPRPITNGMEIKLNNTPVYISSTNNAASTKKTGTYYIWNTVTVNNRIRITNAKNRVGVSGQISGWINVSDIK